jgi:uncharacterized lipoprotein YmbA
MRHRHSTRIRALCALGVIALAGSTGCFSLARTSPPLEEFALGSGHAVTRVATRLPADSSGRTIGMRRVDLAAYLATPAIVVRRGGRITSSNFHRWGEDPAAGVTRALSEYLGATPQVRAVDVTPWPIRSRHDFVLQLHVARMEGIAPDDSTAKQGGYRVAASWEVFRPDDGALLARGESDRREDGWTVGDYRGLVTLLEKGLEQLAGDVAACLVQLDPVMPKDGVAVVRPATCRR